MAQDRTPFNVDQGTAAVVAARAGLPGVKGSKRLGSWKLWHRVNHLVEGQSNLTFFNEPGQYSNLEQANQIPSGIALILRTLRLKFIYGIDRDGVRIRTPGAATGVESMLSRPFATAAASAVMAELMERLRETMLMGRLAFRIGQETIVDAADLTTFPSGGDLVVAGAGWGGSAATAPVDLSGAGLLSVSNGAPVFSNAWTFGPGGLPIMGGGQFSVGLSWQAAVPFNVAIANGGVAPTTLAAGSKLNCGHWLVSMDVERVSAGQ